MRVRLACSTEDAVEASRRLETWLQSVEAGELDGDEMLHELTWIVEAVQSQRAAVMKALG